MNQDIYSQKKASFHNTTSTFYLHELEQAPIVKALIADGTLIEDRPEPTIMSASDYSYSASYYAGPNYRIIGDAAGAHYS